VTDISLSVVHLVAEREAAVVPELGRKNLERNGFAVGGDDDEEDVGSEILFWVNQADSSGKTTNNSLLIEPHAL